MSFGELLVRKPLHFAGPLGLWICCVHQLFAMCNRMVSYFGVPFIATQCNFLLAPAYPFPGTGGLPS